MDKPSIVISGSAVLHVNITTDRRSLRDEHAIVSDDDERSGIPHKKSHLEISRDGTVTGTVSESPSQGNNAVSDIGQSVTYSNLRQYIIHLRNPKFYQIQSTPKGRVLLINNSFTGQPNERHASTKDLQDMEDLWKIMGCHVVSKEDLTAEQLLQSVQEFASDKEEADYFVVMVMSHGRKDDLIVGNEQGKVAAKRVIDAIANSERFRGKPKLVFFQMCRGVRCQSSDAPEGPEIEPFDTEDDTWIMKLLQEVLEDGRILGAKSDETDADVEDYDPTDPDMLVAFATQPDHKAFLNEKEGSWFIQSIKKVFAREAATHDVVYMLEEVKKEVSKHKAYAPGRRYNGATETVDAGETFGPKRLMLFPGIGS